MTCTIRYIEEQPFSQSEKERLTNIYIDVFDKAYASKIFRQAGERLVASKHGYAKALDVISKLNAEYGAGVVKLSKIVSTGNTEQFALNVNVLPLSTEKQYTISFDKTELFNHGDIPIDPSVHKYVTDEAVDVKTVIERLLKDETGVTEKEVLTVMLRNSDKINAKVRTEDGLNSQGTFRIEFIGNSVIDTQILINSKAIHSEGVRATILHELVHAYALAVVGNPITEEEKAFDRNLTRRLEKAREQLKDKKLLGLKDKHEFLAELASNKTFRNVLKSGLGESFWDSIIRLFRNLFGLGSEFDTLLNNLYELIDNNAILENYTKEGVFNKPLESKAKKSLDALEKMVHILNQRIKKLEYKGLHKEQQEVETTKAELSQYMLGKRNLAVLTSLTFIQTDLNKLKEDYKKLITDPANINPDKLRNIGEQLASYDVVESFSNQIEKSPEQFVLDSKDIPALRQLLRDLRVSINLFRQDIQDLNIKRAAYFIKGELNNPKAVIEDIEDQLKVADRDLTWWNRMAESARGFRDWSVTAVFKALERTFSQAYQDNLQDDLYRQESKEEVLNYKTWKPGPAKGDWFNNERKFKSVGILKAEEEYENWAKKQGIKSPGA